MIFQRGEGETPDKQTDPFFFSRERFHSEVKATDEAWRLASMADETETPLNRREKEEKEEARRDDMCREVSEQRRVVVKPVSQRCSLGEPIPSVGCRDFLY